MGIVLIVLVVFASIFALGYPLVNARRYPLAQAVPSGVEQLETLEASRDSLLDAIRDLEFDHQIGKLSDADYKQMRATYDAKTMGVLQQLDAAQATNKKSAAPARGTGRLPSAERGETKQFCARCGTRLQATDKFCVKCGTRV